MNLNKAEKRDKLRDKRNKGMQVKGRSCFVIQRVMAERAEKLKKEKLS